MDAGVGKIMDWVEGHGLEDDTVIIFASDNGMNLGQHGIWGKGNGTYPPNMYDSSVKRTVHHQSTWLRGTRKHLLCYGRTVRYFPNHSVPGRL